MKISHTTFFKTPPILPAPPFLWEKSETHPPSPLIFHKFPRTKRPPFILGGGRFGGGGEGEVSVPTMWYAWQFEVHIKQTIQQKICWEHFNRKEDMLILYLPTVRKINRKIVVIVLIYNNNISISTTVVYPIAHRIAFLT